jgi:hypothetical protein
MEAERLCAFVGSLGRAFKIHTDIDGNYNHIGATIADAILQANRDYEKIVRPRVRAILVDFSECRTTANLNKLLETVTVNTFLDYNGTQRKQRFVDVLALFTREAIETTDDLKRWLSEERSLVKLRAVKESDQKQSIILKSWLAYRRPQ